MTDAPLRILCIEDNPVNWRLVQRLLKQAGYEMHWAEDGLKGFDLALEVKPDLVLLDINLPGLSGFEVATKFRQQPELAQVPLVALTAKTLKSDRETALVAGCDGFIPKPIDPFTFVKQVESYLGGHREQIEEAREGPALRQFNVQVLGHLEVQLKESQETNKKLLDAQGELEIRNRSLSRLLALAQGILAERDPKTLLLRILEQARIEVRATRLCAYRIHPSGGYWEGLKWNGQAFEDAPTLPKTHGFLDRARQWQQGTILWGSKLRGSRLWEEGLLLGLWKPGMDCSLLLLIDRQNESETWGFWAFERDEADPFHALELEMMSLHASIAQVAIENAELIENLDESSRALASSYERMEAAYQDLHKAKVDLSRQDRQVLLEDLFFKITQRLEAPVLTLHHQSQSLDQLVRKLKLANEAEEATKAISEIREAVSKVDGLLKGLLRRVGKEGTTPEWINLHDLLQQEIELLQTEGAIPPEVAVTMDLQSRRSTVFGVYSDFAKLLLNLTQHALGGPTPSPTLRLRSWREDERFHFEIADEGGPILPAELDTAFEPFSVLHQQVVIGVRSPGTSLALCKQLLAAYHGEIEIRNEGDGTLIHVRFPLKG
jgi:DNA-binding response OmpR family regulator/signal transduction histidine kinase